MSKDIPEAAVFADIVSKLMYGIAGWLSVTLGILGLVGAIGGGIQRPSIVAATLFLVSILLIIFGLFVNPRFRRRLERRGPITQFGQTRKVDSRVVHSGANEQEYCIVCDSEIADGLVRRYREEISVAGIPAYTLSTRLNHYCADCAIADFSISDDMDKGEDKISDKDIIKNN